MDTPQSYCIEEEREEDTGGGYIYRQYARYGEINPSLERLRDPSDRFGSVVFNACIGEGDCLVVIVQRGLR